MLSDEKANLLATVSFIRENCFTLEFYALEKSNSRFTVVNLPAGQYHIQKCILSLMRTLGVLTATRRPDCLLFQTRAGTLMHFTESGIKLKQGCLLFVGIDEL